MSDRQRVFTVPSKDKRVSTEDEEKDDKSTSNAAEEITDHIAQHRARDKESLTPPNKDHHLDKGEGSLQVGKKEGKIDQSPFNNGLQPPQRHDRQQPTKRCCKLAYRCVSTLGNATTADVIAQSEPDWQSRVNDDRRDWSVCISVDEEDGMLPLKDRPPQHKVETHEIVQIRRKVYRSGRIEYYVCRVKVCKPSWSSEAQIQKSEWASGVQGNPVVDPSGADFQAQSFDESARNQNNAPGKRDRNQDSDCQVFTDEGKSKMQKNLP